jgi:biotin operon repressor
MAGGTTDRKIDKLIHLLVKNATVVVPGPKIASEIGVTRSTVWDYIEKLRALGVEIKGHPSRGYQLQKLPDILAPSLIRPEIGDNQIGHRGFRKDPAGFMHRLSCGLRWRPPPRR